jgi:twinkle protein
LADDNPFVGHEPCPQCGSDDNLGRYADGFARCYSQGCGYIEKSNRNNRGRHERVGERKERGKPKRPLLEGGRHSALASRGLTAETAAKFNYLQGRDEDDVPCHIATYYDSRGVPCAQKVRYANKDFSWRGDSKAAVLFGQQLWSHSRMVVITEGEIDAMAVSQVQGLKWPVVSIKNGADAAKRDLAHQIEWLEGFDTIVLCFDNDPPGQGAAAECAELFTPGKARIAKLPLKDAGEMVEQGRGEELIRAIWNAQPWRPDGIVSGVDLIDRALAPPPESTPYPWEGLNRLLRGQRRGEITTWCAGTGTGKSQAVREIAHYLRSKGEQVGIIALEQSASQAALDQVSLEMERRLHDPTVREGVDEESIRAAAHQALQGLHFYEHFGSLELESLLPKIKYMAHALGVRSVILDHISIMVSGMATDGDERKRIDVLMTRLRSLVEELGLNLHLVSHLRKAGGVPHEEGGRITLDDLRGSGAIKQLSDNIVALERDQQAEDPSERNKTTLRVLKCRRFGETGVATELLYNPETGRMRELDSIPAALPADAPANQGGEDF